CPPGSRSPPSRWVGRATRVCWPCGCSPSPMSRCADVWNVSRTTSNSRCSTRTPLCARGSTGEGRRFLELFPQPPLEDLPGGGDGDRVDETDLPYPFVGQYLLVDGLHEGVGRHPVLARRAHHERDG